MNFPFLKLYVMYNFRFQMVVFQLIYGLWCYELYGFDLIGKFNHRLEEKIPVMHPSFSSFTYNLIWLVHAT